MDRIESDDQRVRRLRGDAPDPPRDRLRLEAAEPGEYPDQIGTVDPGEAAVLVLAYEHDGVAATDDGDAREVAGSLDIDSTGSLGVLAKAVHADVIDVETADEWLAEWIEYGYYSPVKSVSELL
ncbi:MAG: hypothetical protein ABEH90_00735 [Halolamina sp.]